MFAAAAAAAGGDGVPHSQLAHQEGVGVDDTRMDLSQFDEAAAAAAAGVASRIQSTSTAHAALQPEVFVTVGDDDLEQLGEPAEGAEGSELLYQGLDPNVNYSETGFLSAEGSAPNSRAASPTNEPASVSGAEESQHGEVAAIAVRSSNLPLATSASSQEEQPSTSSGSQGERPMSGDKQEAMPAHNKPKIQRIVWEEGRSSAGQQQSAGPTAATSHSNIIPLMNATPDLAIVSQQRRGSGSVSRGGGYVGGAGFRAGQQRPQRSLAPQQLLGGPRQPGGSVQGQRHPQVARRTRGPRSFF
jgi:hypothetical protein